MTDYWLTVLVDFQRTMDVRVSGENYPQVIEKYKTMEGRKVIAVRPCDKEVQTTDSRNLGMLFHEFLQNLNQMGLSKPTLIQLKDKYQALKIIKLLEDSGTTTGESQQPFSRAAQDVEAGVLHGFYVSGVEFCWPGEQALADFGLGGK